MTHALGPLGAMIGWECMGLRFRVEGSIVWPSKAMHLVPVFRV